MTKGKKKKTSGYTSPSSPTEFDPEGYCASPSPPPLQRESPEKKKPRNATNYEKKNRAPKPVPCPIDISSISDSNSSSYHQKQIEDMRNLYQAQLQDGLEQQRLQFEKRFEKEFAQLAQKFQSAPVMSLPSSSTNMKESRLPDKKKKKKVGSTSSFSDDSVGRRSIATSVDDGITHYSGSTNSMYSSHSSNSMSSSSSNSQVTVSKQQMALYTQNIFLRTKLAAAEKENLTMMKKLEADKEKQMLDDSVDSFFIKWGSVIVI